MGTALPGLDTTTQASAPAVEKARRWFIIDAADQTLGRMATKIATVLMGKHKPTFVTYIDSGDFVIVINAEKVKVTGKKREQKVYSRYSGYPGGRREIPFATMAAKQPERIVELAVRNMLPHSTLGKQMFKKLKVYKGPKHPHAAQCPKPFPF